MIVKDLDESFLNSFYNFFTEIIREDFPEYSKENTNYFLEKLYPLRTFEANLKTYFRKVLVSLEGQDLTGFLVGDNTFGGVGFISWLGVKKLYRNQGIGSNLINEYEKYAKSQGAHLLEAYTFPKTVNFYKKIGFSEIGRREKGYFLVPNIIMDKEI